MMARKVERTQIIDYQSWGDRREQERERIMAVKAVRRVHVGEHMTFLFENAETVRYQIQEMMRAEQIVREDAIQHEIETYNELIGEPGELGCVLLVEIDDAEKRDVLLREWIELPHHLYAELEDGTKVRPRFDERQIGRGRLSSVQYLIFPTDGKVPVAIGSDLPKLELRTELSEEQHEALHADVLAN